MTATPIPFPISRLRCHYRPLILAIGAPSILCGFWFASRYPQLLAKSGHLGEALPSMAYSSEGLQVAADAPLWQKIAFGAVNWLDNLNIGIGFAGLTGWMRVTNYGILLVGVLGIVRAMISGVERSHSLKPFTVGEEHDACAVNFSVGDCSEPFWSVFREMARSYGQHVWMLLK